MDNGWHIAPDGSDDTHETNWDTCGTREGALAPELSERNTTDAMRNRRCYSTDSRGAGRSGGGRLADRELDSAWARVVGPGEGL